MNAKQFYRYVFLFLLSVFVLTGCGNSKNSKGVTSSSIDNIGGIGQKGPFDINSLVTAYKLDNGVRGVSVSTKTTDKLGHYTLFGISWSGATEIVIQGKYFNEVTGVLSSNKASLSAVVNVVRGNSVSANVNVLTDLVAKRFIKKAKDGASISIDTAQNDIATLFGLDLGTNSLTDLDLTDGSASGKLKQLNAELLRISSAIIQLAIAKGQQPYQILDDLAKKISETGTIEKNDSTAVTLFNDIKRKARDINLTQISNNIRDAGLGDGVVPPTQDDLDDEADDSWIEPITVLDDINITVEVKGHKTEQNNGTTDNLAIAETVPSHGNVNYFKIGNEVPAFQYTSTDCYVGLDIFTYNTANEIGRVNVTITKPTTTDTPNFTKTLYNNQVIHEDLIPNNPNVTITRQAEHGVATLRNPSGEYVIYDYNPADDYNGTDYFEYTVTETINGCTYTSTGSVTFTVQTSPPLDDINIIVEVKGHKIEQNNGTTDNLATAETEPSHGNVNYFKIGNEVPAFQYTSTDCYVGLDTFTYNTANEIGRVNVTITKPTTTNTPNFTKTLYNNQVIHEDLIPNNPNVTITRQAEHGVATLRNPSGEYVIYDYNPADNYNGIDYFEYTVTETINGCTYTSTGRVTLTINAHVPALHIFAWDDGSHGTEPWVTDGTVANTRLLKDISPNGDDSSYPSLNYGNNVELNSILYFSARTDGNMDYELWRTDLTTSGTYKVVDLAPEVGHGSHPLSITQMGNNIYFMALTGNTSDSDNFSGSKGIWKTNGDINNSTLVKDFGEYSGTGYSAPGYMYSLGDKLIFQQDYDSGNGPNWNPWISDGINSNVSRLKGNTFEGANRRAFMWKPILFNGSYYGSANDGEHGEELWKTDGTSSGTVMVKNIVQSVDNSSREQGSYPFDITVAGNKLFFTALKATEVGDSIEYDKSLWVSDGTDSGTVMIKDDTATPIPVGGRNRFSNLTSMGGELYFIYKNVNSNGETTGEGTLWKSAGTEATTVMIKDINISSESLIATSDTLFFWSGSSLWKSDGSSTGTQEVKHLSSNYYAHNFTTHEGLVYFKIDNYDENKIEYWRSDGTSEGTIKLVDVAVQMD